MTDIAVKPEPKPVTEQEFIEMGKRASEEIKMLRRQIERLAPRAEAYDNLVSVLNLLPRTNSGGIGEDLAWRIDQRIKELKP